MPPTAVREASPGSASRSSTRRPPRSPHRNDSRRKHAAGREPAGQSSGGLDLTSGKPVWHGAVPVGLDPVAVRARTNTEAWVVNHISDSVSVVDLATMSVVPR